MQDEVRDKTVVLIINAGKTGGKLTAGILRAAIRHYMNPAVHHGRQTVRQLVRQGRGVQNIEITNRNIRSFERVARKYGVDFALKKDKASGKYLVFFKGQDADALNAAFSEYADKTLRRKTRGKPSILAQLSQHREAVRNQARAVTHHLNKGGIEL